jgi:hypothetical protein
MEVILFPRAQILQGFESSPLPDRGRHFSDGETNRVGPVNFLVWEDNRANLIGLDTQSAPF